MSTLPPQVKEQIDAAKALRDQLYGEKPALESATPNATSTAVEQGTTPAATPPVEPNAAPLAPATVASTPETPPVDDENSPTYAQRWRTLQGQQQRYVQRIDSLEQMIAAMQSTPQRREAPPPAPAPQKFITDKDETDFGTDMVDFARRVTREEMTPVMQALNSMQRRLEQLGTLAPKVQHVAEQQHLSAEERFYARLTDSVADWRDVNDNPAFHDWLLSPDNMTGITRQTYLEDAHASFDLDRVVSIFTAWKREAGVQNPVAAPTTPNPTAGSKLEKMVAPGRANAATAAPSSKADIIWTRASIAKFFEDKRTGKFKGKEAEMAAMERDIFQAQKQGRVDFAAA